MSKNFNLSIPRKRLRTARFKWGKYFSSTAFSGTALSLVLAGALILPQTAQAVDENSNSDGGTTGCTLSGPGDIADDGTSFTLNASGSDFKITCVGALVDRLDNASIMSIEADLESSGYDPGTSKILLDVNGVTSKDYRIAFVSVAGLNILTGDFTSDAFETDGVAISLMSEDDVDDVNYGTAINAENRAVVTVKGAGRKAFSITGVGGANASFINRGTITTSGDVHQRPVPRYDGDQYPNRRSDGVSVETYGTSGDVTIENHGTVTINAKAAKGLTGGVAGTNYDGTEIETPSTGSVTIDNYGKVTTTGDAHEFPLSTGYPDDVVEDINRVYRPYGVQAYIENGGTGNIDIENHEPATIETEGLGSRGITAFSESSGSIEIVNRGTVTNKGGAWQPESEPYLSRPYGVYGNSQGGGNVTVENYGRVTTGDETKTEMDRQSDTSGESIAISGTQGHALRAVTEGINPGIAKVVNDGDGTIITWGDRAHGMSTWVNGDSGKFEAEGVNRGTITTDGDNADGMLILAGDNQTPGSEIIATNSGTITVNGDSVDDGNANGISAGFWMDGDEDDGTYSGDALGTVTVTNTGTVTTTGEGATTIAAGFWAAQGNTIVNSGNVIININGGTVMASGDGSTALYAETHGTGRSTITIQDNAKVTAAAGDAVWIKGAGTLNLLDSSLVGNISFTEGEYDDVFTIEQAGSGSIDGNINFFGGEDEMNIQIAENQHFVINGNIMGLETMNKTGSGFLRLNGEVQFAGSTLNLDDGVLVIAGQLNLRTGKMTVKEASKLIFEIGEGHNHGYVSAGSVHFDSDNPVVFAQVSESADATKVREQISSGLPFFYVSGIDGITSGMDESPVPVTDIKVQSESSGDTVNVGNIVIDNEGVGMVTFDNVDQVAVLDLPEMMVTTSGGSSSGGSSGGSSSGGGSTNTSGAAAASSGSSSSSGGGGAVLGLGLLAVLLGSFLGDDASAGFGDYYFNTPQSAYIASINERGVMTIKETGNQPYQMWIRTGQTAQPMRMTGVSNTGVSGTEVGLNLYNSDTFYINTSVAPNVAAEVGSLNLAAKGEVYSLSSGWRNDRYFAGLRLSHGEFEVNSIVDNPIVNSALISNAKLRNTQAQLRAGMNLSTGALRFTPSASIQVGTYENSEHVAESPALEATIPSYTQDYTSVQLGLKMTSDKWLSFTNGSKWKPQLKFDSIHTDSKDTGSLTLRQSDKVGALSFNTNAGLRSMPDMVNSMSFGAKVKSSANDQAEWKFGFAGLEADGEEYYAAMAAYQLKF